MQKNIFFLLIIFLTIFFEPSLAQKVPTTILETKYKGVMSLTLGGGIFGIVNSSDDDYRILRYGRFRGNYFINKNFTSYMEYNFGKRTFSKTPINNKRFHAIGVGGQYYLPIVKKIFFLDIGYHVGNMNYFEDLLPKKANILSTLSYGAGLNFKVYKQWHLGLDFKRYQHLYEAINYTAGSFNVSYFFSKNKEIAENP